jgi:hypothetical protein
MSTIVKIWSLYATPGAVCWVKAMDLGEALENELYGLIRCPVAEGDRDNPVVLDYIACRLNEERTSVNVFLVSRPGAIKSAAEDEHLHLLSRRRLEDQRVYWQARYVQAVVSRNP